MEKSYTLTKEWADAYCQRLMNNNNLSFPFHIGRKKQWGGIDSTSLIRSLDDFFPAYQEYDSHPRCVAIMLITSTDTISI
jgi:hypothetical protein